MYIYPIVLDPVGGKISPRNYSLFPSSFHRQIFWTCLHLLHKPLDYHLFPYSPASVNNLPSLYYMRSQSMVPEATETSASASVGHLLEVEIFWPHCRTTKSDSLARVVREKNCPEICVLTSAPRNSNARYSQNHHSPGTTLSKFNNDLWFTISISCSSVLIALYLCTFHIMAWDFLFPSFLCFCTPLTDSLFALHHSFISFIDSSFPLSGKSHLLSLCTFSPEDLMHLWSQLFILVMRLLNFVFYPIFSISLQVCVANCFHRHAISMLHGLLKGRHQNPNTQSAPPPKQLLFSFPVSLTVRQESSKTHTHSCFSFTPRLITCGVCLYSLHFHQLPNRLSF